MKEGCYNAKGKWDLKEECYFKIMQKVLEVIEIIKFSFNCINYEHMYFNV